MLLSIRTAGWIFVVDLLSFACLCKKAVARAVRVDKTESGLLDIWRSVFARHVWSCVRKLRSDATILLTQSNGAIVHGNGREVERVMISKQEVIAPGH